MVYQGAFSTFKRYGPPLMMKDARRAIPSSGRGMKEMGGVMPPGR